MDINYIAIFNFTHILIHAYVFLEFISVFNLYIYSIFVLILELKASRVKIFLIKLFQEIDGRVCVMLDTLRFVMIVELSTFSPEFIFDNIEIAASNVIVLSIFVACRRVMVSWGMWFICSIFNFFYIYFILFYYFYINILLILVFYFFYN